MVGHFCAERRAGNLQQERGDRDERQGCVVCMERKGFHVGFGKQPCFIRHEGDNVGHLGEQNI